MLHATERTFDACAGIRFHTGNRQLVSSCCHRSYPQPSPLQLICPWQGHQPCLESRKGLPPSFTIHYFWDWNIQMKYFFYIKTQTVIKNLPPTPHILSSVEIEASCLLSVGGIPKYLPESPIISIDLRIPLPLWYLCISVHPVPMRGSICCKVFGKSVNPFVLQLSIWEWERAVQGDLKVPGDSTWSQYSVTPPVLTIPRSIFQSFVRNCWVTLEWQLSEIGV